MALLRTHIIRLIAIGVTLFVSLWLGTMPVSAQFSDKEFVDSILNLITPNTPDTTKGRLYHEIARTCNSSEIVLKYANLALQYSAPEDTTSQVGVYSCIIWASLNSGKPRDGINAGKKALALCGDNPNQLSSKNVILSMMSSCYDDINCLDSSLLCQTELIDIATAIDNHFMLCYGYQRLAITCLDRKFGEASLEYIDSLEAISRRHNMTLHIASAYYLRSRQKVNSIIDSLDNLIMATDYLKKALSIFDTINLPPALLNSYYCALLSGQEIYFNLYNLTQNEAYADSSFLFYKRCGTWFKDNGMTDFLIQQTYYANYLLIKNRPKEALKAVKECEPFLQDSMHNLFKQMYHKALANCYSELKNYNKALENRKLALRYLMLVNNEQSSDDISDFKVLTYSKQRKKLDEIERANMELQNQLENRHSRIVLYFTIAGLLLLLTAVLFLWRSFALKRKTNNELFVKNSLLSQQREEIEAQRDVLTSQTQSLEKVNRRIMASVNYAQRIQHAAMPSEDEMRKIFPHSFVYFCPKAVVSGDFYYATAIDGCRVIILGDCTGHGIPGGFLSMLGIFGLKEFLRTKEDALNPAAVLDKMKRFVINSLASDQANVVMNDGMEMTLCTIAPDNSVIKYASANQSAVVISNGKLVRLSGDIMPVGKFLDYDESFSTYETHVSPGDMLYLFSDGVFDQIGGCEEGKDKRLQKKNLETYLFDLSTQPIEKQCVQFEEYIVSWRGARSQTDDMSLIGIQI